ncbi:arginase family protein [Candidatus Woesearchaeota archaeon]|nr:arginase family protein [Candidatus Woesearchaeota archaeon]MBW3022077.1 arginase family protein [Candidatus Woesearchaeota archaeon]
MKIIKIASDLGALDKKGSAKGPDEIVRGMYDLYLNEDGEYREFEVDSVDVDKGNIDNTNENIFNKIKSINEHCIVLGGDHSVTYAAFKAFASNNPGAGIVVFDAHPDCENNFSPPSHEDFLRVLIEEGVVDASRVIIVGLRNWHSNEFNFLRDKKIKYFAMKEVFDRGVKEVCDAVMFVAKQWPSLYLSIDIDAVDPAFAPGTGYCEPGGLTSRELLYFVQRMKNLKNLKIVDLVEINPEKDNGLTVKLGSKIVKEFL